jgi:NADPH:quinone reductase-like Zn-dependent oxidoreductase
MKAILFHDYGGPEVMKLEEMPRPAIKEDEILVHVLAMGVNPVDWKIREGLVRQRIKIPLPGTPGGDISGVVEQVGTAVRNFSVGQPVFAYIGLLGAYSEYVAIKASSVAAKPSSMDHVHAGSVPLAALTAWQALFDKGDLKAGQQVLLHAAAGGVGSFAVQFARNAGAQVVGTCSPNNADYVVGLGAHSAVDYHAGSFDALAGQFDLVLDTMGGATGLQSLQLLKAGGIHVGVAPPSEALVQQLTAAGKRSAGMQVQPNGGQLSQIAALIDAGKVHTTLAAVFPLAEAGRAHDLSKTGHTRGKIVLRSDA